MINSFASLGDDSVLSQVSEDISYLFDTAKTEKFTPVLLSIGIKVIEIGCVHKVKQDLGINNLNEFLKTRYPKFSFHYRKEIMDVYERCDKNLGIFDKESYTVPVIFNPDEDYLTLHVKIETAPEKGKKEKASVEVYVITFKPDEILVNFNYTNDN